MCGKHRIKSSDQERQIRTDGKQVLEIQMARQDDRDGITGQDMRDA